MQPLRLDRETGHAYEGKLIKLKEKPQSSGSQALAEIVLPYLYCFSYCVQFKKKKGKHFNTYL